MQKILYVYFTFTLLYSCAQEIETNSNRIIDASSMSPLTSPVNEEGTTISSRFNTPAGYSRVKSDELSFAFYLQNLPLKKHGASVKLYDGRIKQNYDVYAAVVDLDIGKRNLHQCADAIMRLRAEHLWNQKKYNEIHFNFTNGFRVDYSEWMKGKRMIVKGNKTYWSERNSPSNTYQDFWKFMELIFNYAGTLSLSKELKTVNLKDIEIGDVFIKGGSPGHAVIVVDLAKNENNEKVFLLAQSYMPAQDLQILKNPNNRINPWYAVEDCIHGVETPEWSFEETQLKRF